MSWKASAAAKELTQGTQGQKLSMADKLVLMILSENYIEDKGFVWCSQKQLSKQCVCTDRGLRGILERLERFQLVGIVHRERKGNYYTLLFMRNPVPQRGIHIEEPHALYEEAGAGYEERGALLEEQLVPHERLTVKKTVDGIAAQEDLEPESKSVTDRDLADLWRDMRRAYKRKVGKTLGAGIYGNLGEKFRDIVNRHGQEKVLSGFMAYVEGKGKDYLRGRKIPIWNFLDEAEEWIDDAAITEEQPQDDKRNEGPRGVGSKYAKL